MSSGFYGWSGSPPLERELRGTAVRVTGRPGAAADSGLGGGTTAGAPTDGSFRAGEVIVDQTGQLWICTTAGSPGAFTLVPKDVTQARGDLIVRGGSALGRLAVGTTAGYALLSNATDPYYGDAAHDGPTRWEPITDSAGSCLVTATTDPIVALTANG